jgi:2,3-bisphosphoglycerate-independent phosphoglycerate mutase
VHATEEHLYALLELARREKLTRVFVHVFSDGRDTPPRSALTYIDRLERKMTALGVGKIASVMGRYYAMDRALNWDRVQRAYDCLVHGTGLHASSAKAAIEHAYARADATIATRAGGASKDVLIETTSSCSRPSSRARRRTARHDPDRRRRRALQLPPGPRDPIDARVRRGRLHRVRTRPRLDVCYRGLTRYYDEFPYAVLPPMNMDELVGEIVSKAGLWQLRIAEYQKYRHVTSFFNGKQVKPYPGEDRILVPSVTVTEDQKPEMSAYEVTDLAVIALRDGIAAVRARAATSPACEVEIEPSRALPAERGLDTYDLVVLNYANCDMVGHTGVLDAAIKAVSVTDECIGRVIEAARARGGTVLVTSDHGNAEQMLDPDTGAVQTAHTTNDVECVLVSDARRTAKLRPHGVLADIGPTLLELLGLPIPVPVTAESLIEK